MMQFTSSHSSVHTMPCALLTSTAAMLAALVSWRVQRSWHCCRHHVLNTAVFCLCCAPQWFADLGNADAAREAARLLAEAAPAGGRNYEQAIRYLNQASKSICQLTAKLVSAGASTATVRCAIPAPARAHPPLTALPAHRWLQAAAAEDSTAMAHLGHIYANGQGVKQDNATAVRWFKKAADHGACGRDRLRVRLWVACWVAL